MSSPALNALLSKRCGVSRPAAHCNQQRKRLLLVNRRACALPLYLGIQARFS